MVQSRQSRHSKYSAAALVPQLEALVWSELDTVTTLAARLQRGHRMLPATFATYRPPLGSAGPARQDSVGGNGGGTMGDDSERAGELPALLMRVRTSQTVKVVTGGI